MDFEKDDETVLKEYTDIFKSRVGTYPKNNISFEDLKFFNKISSKTYVIEDTTFVKYNGKAWQPEIPPEITVIGEGTFAENKIVRDIIIRKGVTKIEDFMVYGCESVSITIAPTVTYIGDNIFRQQRMSFC